VSSRKIQYGALRLGAANSNTPQHYVWCDSYKLVDAYGKALSFSGNFSLNLEIPQTFPALQPELRSGDFETPWEFICEDY